MNDIEPICSKCFDDEDLADFIEYYDGPAGCAFCGQNDAPTAPLDEVTTYMRERLETFYGYAADHLPYESREGGYIGSHWTTYELLYEDIGLSLPRDNDDKLLFALPHSISEEIWCEYDWLSLDYDEALDYSWKSFCKIIQHERRFFFALSTEPDVDDEEYDRDKYSPLVLLNEIVKLTESFDMVETLPEATEFYRCRPCDAAFPFTTARDLGPAPAELTVQANRMNPPGIPMMYGAETEELAIRETRSPCVTAGRFRLERDANILNLADLPPIPGIFSDTDRFTRSGIIFMHAFSREISRPVDRTDRIHIEYIPSQVVTEYFRDATINGSHIDGICYPSALDGVGQNLVLFATQDDLMEPDGTQVADQDYHPTTPWIRLLDSHLVEQAVVETDN